MKNQTWDAVIVGGGPAGLAAGLHLARAGYSTLLAERSRFGGQAAGIARLENCPGAAPGPGAALMRRWLAQARSWKLKAVRDEVLSLRRAGDLFEISLAGAGRLRSRSVLWCGGAAFRKLGARGEAAFAGRGLWNTAAEAGPLRGLTAAVVGGGEAAAQQAALIARKARNAYLICRGSAPKAHPLLLARLAASGAEILGGFEVKALKGRSRLEALVLRPLAGGPDRELAARAAFALVGKEPRRVPASWRRDPPGFYRAGDAARGRYRQVAIAAGDGVRAAMDAVTFLEDL